METILGYVGLTLMVVFFLILVVMEVLLKKTFKKLYSGEKKLAFWSKVTWLKENMANFEEDKAAIERIVQLRMALVVTAVLMFGSYILGAS